MKIDVRLPLDKGDEEGMRTITSYPFEELKKEQKYIDSLLSWIQDMHWPIAHIAADYLEPHANELTNEIKEIYKSNDGTWIYNVTKLFFIDTDYKLNDTLIMSLLALKSHPSRLVHEEINELLPEAIGHLKAAKMYNHFPELR